MNLPFNSSPYSKYAVISATVHVSLIVLGISGVLSFTQKPLEIAQPISVELVDTIEEQSKSPDPLPPQKENEETKPLKKEAPKQNLEQKSEPEPEPLKLEEKVPLPPEKPIENPVKKPDEKKPELPDPLTTIADKTPQKKPKLKPVSIDKKTPQKKETKPKDFDALLKNLMEDQSPSKNSHAGDVSDHLAANEMDIVRKQIESVWRLPAGIQDIHTKTISIKMTLKQDRTVQSASLVKHSINDPAEQLLAESALRAVNTFKYEPLKLPPEKYKTWREITLEFDPRHLF